MALVRPRADTGTKQRSAAQREGIVSTTDSATRPDLLQLSRSTSALSSFGITELDTSMNSPLVDAPTQKALPPSALLNQFDFAPTLSAFLVPPLMPLWIAARLALARTREVPAPPLY